MTDATESNRQTIRDAFAAWQAGTAPITDVFAPDMVWRIEGHSVASREYANRDAFVAPGLGQFGNAPRNSITGPRTFSLDASVSRTFRVNNRLNLDWRIDATNVLNRVTYAGVVTSITSPQFGFPNRANDMRRLRSSIRVRF